MTDQELAELQWLVRNNGISKPVIEKHVLKELVDVYMELRLVNRNADLVDVPSIKHPMHSIR